MTVIVKIVIIKKNAKNNLTKKIKTMKMRRSQLDTRDNLSVPLLQ